MTASTKNPVTALLAQYDKGVANGSIVPKPARKPAKAKPALTSVDAQLNRFSVQAWRADLITAAKSEASASTKLLELALAAREIVEKDTAREAFQDAYVAAHLLQNPEITDEQARSLASVRNRVSEAMAVFKAKVLPDPMPKNLSRAADACRKLNAKPKVDTNEKLDPETEQDEAEDSLDAGRDVAKLANGDAKTEFDVLMLALEAIQRRAVNNPSALVAITAMMDLADDVLVALTTD